MEPLAILGALWAIGAGLLAPGAAAVRALDVGRDPLERFVLTLALGRIGLAGAALLATSTVGPAGLQIWALAGVVAWVASRRLRPSAVSARPRDWTVPALLACAAAAVLVHAVVARGGLLAPDGALVFFGRDSTNDPLVYAATALQLFETGLPMTHPFLAGATSTSTYIPYAVLAGLHGLGGVPMLDLVFRVVPLFDALGTAVAAVALARALGGNRAAMALGGILVALGAECSWPIGGLGGLFGGGGRPLDSWALFGPYLLAFNPGMPALGVFFGAAITLLGLTSARAPRRHAWVLGVLVGSLFETKLFVWAPVATSLVAITLVRPPAAIARPLRIASLASLIVVLPSLVEKALWARRLSGRDVTGFAACVGCLPRYLTDAALGSHDLSFAAFEAFRPGQLLDPATLGRSVLATALVVAIALGARAFAIPVLWRGSRAAGPPARVALHRFAGLAAALGLGASMVFVTVPHYLNGAQFAWIATAGLWPFAAPTFGRWLVERRFVLLALACLLALPSSAVMLARLGWGAPPHSRVTAEEIALMRALHDHSAPGDVVLEPSLIADTDFPSPVTWLAARSSYLSLLSAGSQLPKDEMHARFERLVAVYAGTNAAAALAAIDASGAQWVYAPASRALRFDPGARLEPVLHSDAGTVYRVVAP